MRGCPSSFYLRTIRAIKKIPKGKVATYGQIATFAGNPRAARQVAYILHSSSGKEDLPWHRVVNSKGSISLRRRQGYELQKQLLEREGIRFGRNGLINLARYGWCLGQ